jgi:hypothetical protein
MRCRHTRTRACLLPPRPHPFRKREREQQRAARARRMTASSAASPTQPNHPRTAPLSTAVVLAPEDVEHAVGRRREAHECAPGGAGSGCEGVKPLEVAQKQDDA